LASEIFDQSKFLYFYKNKKKNLENDFLFTIILFNNWFNNILNIINK